MLLFCHHVSVIGVGGKSHEVSEGSVDLSAQLVPF